MANVLIFVVAVTIACAGLLAIAGGLIDEYRRPRLTAVPARHATGGADGRDSGMALPPIGSVPVMSLQPI